MMKESPSEYRDTSESLRELLRELPEDTFGQSSVFKEVVTLLKEEEDEDLVRATLIPYAVEKMEGFLPGARMATGIYAKEFLVEPKEGREHDVLDPLWREVDLIGDEISDEQLQYFFRNTLDAPLKRVYVRRDQLSDIGAQSLRRVAHS